MKKSIISSILLLLLLASCSKSSSDGETTDTLPISDNQQTITEEKSPDAPIAPVANITEPTTPSAPVYLEPIVPTPPVVVIVTPPEVIETPPVVVETPPVIDETPPTVVETPTPTEPVITEPETPVVPEIPNLPGKTELKLTCEEARMVKLINLHRKANGLNELKVSESAVESSRWHAKDMINQKYFEHTEPTGRTFFERAMSFGFPAWIENIAFGNPPAEKSFCYWVNSSEHNSNMLESRHGSMGIGNANGSGKNHSYWSNNFGPEMNDNLSDPLNVESCTLPTKLPKC